MRTTIKPTRITARWRAGALELELEAVNDGATGADDPSYLADWRSFQRQSVDSLATRLQVSESGTARVVGGNAETTATIRGIEEFFLTYDITNDHAVIPDQRVNESTGVQRFKKLRFAPQRGRSTVKLVDLP